MQTHDRFEVEGIPKYLPERSRLAFRKIFLQKVDMGPNLLYRNACWARENYAGIMGTCQCFDPQGFIEKTLFKFSNPCRKWLCCEVVVIYTGRLPKQIWGIPKFTVCAALKSSQMQELRSSNPKTTGT